MNKLVKAGVILVGATVAYWGIKAYGAVQYLKGALATTIIIKEKEEQEKSEEETEKTE